MVWDLEKSKDYIADYEGCTVKVDDVEEGTDSF